MNINDAIDAAIANIAGDQNALDDKLLRYYRANGATSLDLDDAEREFLFARGIGAQYNTEENSDPFFSNTVNWNENGGWAVAAGEAVATNLLAGNYITPTSNFTATDTYLLEMKIESISGGGVWFAANAVQISPKYTTPGTHRIEVAVTAGQTPGIIGDVGVNAVLTKFSRRQNIAVHGLYGNQINDLWEFYLRTSKGYSGALDDMKYLYWTTGPRP